MSAGRLWRYPQKGKRQILSALVTRAWPGSAFRVLSQAAFFPSSLANSSNTLAAATISAAATAVDTANESATTTTSLAATVLLTVHAGAGITLANVGLSSDGTNGVSSRTADLSATLGSAALAAAVNSALQAVAANTLGATSIASAAVAKVQAAGGLTLGAISAASSATVKIQAATVNTLAASTLVATGVESIQATSSNTLAATTLVATISAGSSTGTLSVTLDSVGIGSDVTLKIAVSAGAENSAELSAAVSTQIAVNVAALLADIALTSVAEVSYPTTLGILRSTVRRASTLETICRSSVLSTTIRKKTALASKVMPYV